MTPKEFEGRIRIRVPVRRALLRELTGLFEDTSNTDAFTAGDYCNVTTSTPSASVTITAVAVKEVGAVANRVY